MLLRKITKQNIVEILLLPIIFVMIFGLGLILLVFLDVQNYLVYTAWCLISGVVVIVLIGAYTYLMIDEKSVERYVKLKQQIAIEAEKFRIHKEQKAAEKQQPKKIKNKSNK
jgi:hypothetical protein